MSDKAYEAHDVVFDSDFRGRYAISSDREARVSKNKRNDRFLVRLYVPSSHSPDTAFEKVFIMVNGLAEVRPDLYDTLAGEFASHGIPCMLFPLPNHFSRGHQAYADRNDPMRVRDAKAQRTVLKMHLDGLSREPDYFVKGFAQLTLDLCMFLEYVQCDDLPVEWDGFRQSLRPSTRFALLGYSLGGLIVLGSTLYMSREGSGRNAEASPVTNLDSCVVLNSGLSMQDVDASRLFSSIAETRLKTIGPLEHPETLARSMWRGTRLKLYQRHIANNRSAAHFGGYPALLDVFEMVVLGDRRPVYHQRLALNSHRVLFVLGGSDEVFRPRLLSNMHPEIAGLATIEIPRLTHWLSDREGVSKDLLRWRAVICDGIRTFDASHPTIRLLEIAVAMGWLTEAQKLAVIQEQGRSEGELSGEVAKTMGLLTHDQIARAVALQPLLNAGRQPPEIA